MNKKEIECNRNQISLIQQFLIHSGTGLSWYIPLAKVSGAVSPAILFIFFFDFSPFRKNVNRNPALARTEQRENTQNNIFFFLLLPLLLLRCWFCLLCLTDSRYNFNGMNEHAFVFGSIERIERRYQYYAHYACHSLSLSPNNAVLAIRDSNAFTATHPFVNEIRFLTDDSPF